MDTIDFLNGFELPFNMEKGSFEKRICSCKDILIQQISGLEKDLWDIDKTYHVKIIENRFNAILDSFKLVIAGKYSSAYDCFNNMMNTNSSYEKLCTNNPCNPLIGRLFYRIRVIDNPLVLLNKIDMFHIPFEYRHKVKRQRYSLLGLPCLYLGGSIYISWLEMEKPSFHNITYVKFENIQAKLKIIDLGYRPFLVAAFANECEANNNVDDTKRIFVSDYIEWLPLRVACSLFKQHGDSPFIEEYVIPQLLLMWIKENPATNIDGVRYFSTREIKPFNNPHFTCNYVFPPKDVKEKGICDSLNSNWKMCEPVSFQLVSSSGIPLGSTEGRIPREEIELVNGIKWQYSVTVFGNMEAIISLYPMGKCIP